MLDADLEQAIKKMSEAFEVCVKNGPLRPSRKISLTHVNEDFYQEFQVDFIFLQ